MVNTFKNLLEQAAFERSVLAVCGHDTRDLPTGTSVPDQAGALATINNLVERYSFDLSDVPDLMSAFSDIPEELRADVYRKLELIIAGNQEDHLNLFEYTGDAAMLAENTKN